MTRVASSLLMGFSIIVFCQTQAFAQSRIVQPAMNKPAQNTGSNKGIILQNQGPQNTTGNKGIILQTNAAQGGTAAQTTSKKLPPNPCKGKTTCN